MNTDRSHTAIPGGGHSAELKENEDTGQNGKDVAIAKRGERERGKSGKTFSPAYASGHIKPHRQRTNYCFLLLTCFSVSEPNNARLESFQSYVFGFTRPARTQHTANTLTDYRLDA